MASARVEEVVEDEHAGEDEEEALEGAAVAAAQQAVGQRGVLPPRSKNRRNKKDRVNPRPFALLGDDQDLILVFHSPWS